MNKQKVQPLIKLSKDTFCPAPWIESHISVRGNVMPCCIYNETKPFGNVKEQSLPDIINGEVARNTRNELFNGVKHQGCTACWDDEERFGTSYRLEHLKAWKKDSFVSLFNTNEDFSIDPITISRLDLRFDNKCNLKCRICGPLFSTAWHADSITLKNEFQMQMQEPDTTYSESVSDSLFESLLKMLPSVIDIFFAGGEPLIQDKHYQILQYAIDNGFSKNMTLTYNTNFSKLTYKNHNVLEFWKHFREVTCGVSLDDSKERGEYQRKNIIWDKVIENRKKLDGLNNVNFHLSPTISIFNVFHILEFIEEWVEKDLLKVTEKNGLFFNMLHYPVRLNIKNLPDYYKNLIEEKYNAFIQKHSSDDRYKWIFPQLDKVLVMAKEDRTVHLREWFDDFTINIKNLDKIRNEDFYEIFTEYSELPSIMQKELL